VGGCSRAAQTRASSRVWDARCFSVDRDHRAVVCLVSWWLCLLDRRRKTEGLLRCVRGLACWRHFARPSPWTTQFEPKTLSRSPCRLLPYRSPVVVADTLPIPEVPSTCGARPWCLSRRANQTSLTEMLSCAVVPTVSFIRAGQHVAEPDNLRCSLAWVPCVCCRSLRLLWYPPVAG
jgi:hypothetical protein